MSLSCSWILINSQWHCKLTLFYFASQTKGKKSILDVDPEAQALLEMTGKSRHSEGLREPIEDEDDDNWKDLLLHVNIPLFFFLILP